VSGRPAFYGTILQFVHPALDRLKAKAGEDAEEGVEEVDWSDTLNTGGLVPLYPSGQELEGVGLDSAGFRRAVAAALARYAGEIGETLPVELTSRHGLPPLRDALRHAHFPPTREDLSHALRRLKYEELFYFQLALALRRHGRVEEEGIPFTVQSALARKLVDALPFALTAAQKRVLREIADDMKSPRPLNRLLQGDVGSGKTVVALLCMLIAVENGYQAAFMAPTEILAEQHYATLTALLGDLPVTIRLLVGKQKSRLRLDLLEDIRRGSAGIVVGTHALFEKGVEFARLGFVVIDEQHRFGVLQRARLRAKGMTPDVLVMTATPIPRTLSLTLFGDLDVSVIDQLPVGRRPITTLVKPDSGREEIHAFVREQVRAGRQCYFVYPLIEESEKVDLKAATEHFRELSTGAFPDLRLGLIHGRLEGAEKDRVMRAFKARELDILVATTVIEVGIDVPNATVMVIENAERFGLAQLHQLRGRVGRGAEQSYCILLTENWIASRVRKGGGAVVRTGLELEPSQAAVHRLATMAETTDGFLIAERDLQLRGPGDFFGTRQSGIPAFRVADLITDTAVLEAARDDAFAIVASDPRLVAPGHRVMADLLRSVYADAFQLLPIG
jgi:ATP-dependent DNA helicase RecG